MIKAINILVFIFLAFTSVIGQDSLKTEKSEQPEDKTIKHGPRFIDENGDGFNDNAPDHDGDGIPNGLDPDYQGQKNRHRHGFRDLDGDGIDDNLISPEQNRERQHLGPEISGGGNQTPAEEGARDKHQRRKGKNEQ